MTYLFLKLTYTVSRKKKSLKNAKKTQNMVNFFIVNVQKKHENFFYFNDNSFSFFTLPITPLCTTLCLAKCSKCVFNRACYLILFEINILAMRKLTIGMFRRTNCKKMYTWFNKCCYSEKTRLLINTVYITTYRFLVCRQFKRYN